MRLERIHRVVTLAAFDQCRKEFYNVCRASNCISRPPIFTANNTRLHDFFQQWWANRFLLLDCILTVYFSGSGNQWVTFTNHYRRRLRCELHLLGYVREAQREMLERSSRFGDVDRRSMWSATYRRIFRSVYPQETWERLENRAVRWVSSNSPSVWRRPTSWYVIIVWKGIAHQLCWDNKCLPGLRHLSQVSGESATDRQWSTTATLQWMHIDC